MKARLESLPRPLRPWLPLAQEDLEGARLDLREESAAGPLWPGQDFYYLNARV